MTDEELDALTHHDRESVLSWFVLEDAPYPGKVRYYIAAQLAILGAYVAIIVVSFTVGLFIPFLFPVAVCISVYATWKLGPRWFNGIWTLLYLRRWHNAHKH